MTHQNEKTKVTVLGLGAMGSRIATRLLEGGHTVTVWNRTRSAAAPLVKAGAREARTPHEAATGAQFVLSILSDDDACRQVWLGRDGAIHGLEKDAIAIESSTVTPGWIKELATEVAKAGASLIESPVVGSRPQAEAGQLICLAGGKESDVDRARPVLQAFAARVAYMGRHGLGATTKLAVNAFLATQLSAVGESINFLRKAGVDDDRWLNLFANLPIMSPPIAGSMKSMAAWDFSPLFTLKLVEKDLRYFISVADANNAASPVGTTIHDLLVKAIANGWQEENATAVAKVFD